MITLLLHYQVLTIINVNITINKKLHNQNKKLNREVIHEQNSITK